jgi:hypothetical protein
MFKKSWKPYGQFGPARKKSITKLNKVSSKESTEQKDEK